MQRNDQETSIRGEANEQQILVAMATASPEQRVALTRQLAQARAANRSRLGQTHQAVRGERATAFLRPAVVSMRHSAATDWIDAIAATELPDTELRAIARREAQEWLSTKSAMVRSDPVELAVQAAGYARQWAGGYGVSARFAKAAFLARIDRIATIDSTAVADFDDLFEEEREARVKGDAMGDAVKMAAYYDDLGPGFTENSFPQSEKREVARWSTSGGKYTLVLTHGKWGYDFDFYDRAWSTPRSSGSASGSSDEVAIAEIEAQIARGWHGEGLTRQGSRTATRPLNEGEWAGDASAPGHMTGLPTTGDSEFNGSEWSTNGGVDPSLMHGLSSRKMASAWVEESMRGDIAGTTFVIECQGNSATDALIAKLRSQGWECGAKQFEETVEQETDYDGGSTSDDIYSFLVYKTDLDYDDPAMDAVYDRLAGAIETSRNYASKTASPATVPFEVPSDAGARDFVIDQTVAQLGRMNILSISGGRVIPIMKGNRTVGLSLPVSNGYAVNIFLRNDDTYIVQRVFRGVVKGQQTDVYAEEVGEAAYQAGMFRSNDFGGHTLGAKTPGSICPYCDFIGTSEAVAAHIKAAGPGHQSEGTVSDQANANSRKSVKVGVGTAGEMPDTPQVHPDESGQKTLMNGWVSMKGEGMKFDPYLAQLLVNMRWADRGMMEGLTGSVHTAARPLYEIAKEIRSDWKSVNYGAVPYLEAMGELNSVDDMYGADKAKYIVAYFLNNASSWRGETAKRIKAELKAMTKTGERSKKKLKREEGDDGDDDSGYDDWNEGRHGSKTAAEVTRFDDGHSEWKCNRCGTTVERWRGESDVSCSRCGAEYNASGQQLRDDWRGNESNYDDDMGDMEGYERQQVRNESYGSKTANDAGTPEWWDRYYNGDGVSDGVPKDLFPEGGVPLHGDLSPEQTAWMQSRGSRRTAEVDMNRLGEQINAQEFDHCFTLHPDGTITDAPGVYAPSVYNSETNDIDIDGPGWSAMTGMTGQDSYNGAVMHASEYIGSGIAEEMMEMAADGPMTFAITTVEVMPDDDDEDPEPAGWAIVYRNGRTGSRKTALTVSFSTPGMDDVTNSFEQGDLHNGGVRTFAQDYADNIGQPVTVTVAGTPFGGTVQPRTASRRTAAGGMKCSECGASIERDPAGEEPRTWHHNDGDSHDHEAKPAGGSKESSRTAYIGEEYDDREIDGGPYNDTDDFNHDYGYDADDPEMARSRQDNGDYPFKVRAVCPRDGEVVEATIGSGGQEIICPVCGVRIGGSDITMVGRRASSKESKTKFGECSQTRKFADGRLMKCTRAALSPGGKCKLHTLAPNAARHAANELPPPCSHCLAVNANFSGDEWISPKFWADRDAPCTCGREGDLTKNSSVRTANVDIGAEGSRRGAFENPPSDQLDQHVEVGDNTDISDFGWIEARRTTGVWSEWQTDELAQSTQNRNPLGGGGMSGSNVWFDDRSGRWYWSNGSVDDEVGGTAATEQEARDRLSAATASRRRTAADWNVYLESDPRLTRWVRAESEEEAIAKADLAHIPGAYAFPRESKRAAADGYDVDPKADGHIDPIAGTPADDEAMFEPGEIEGNWNTSRPKTTPIVGKRASVLDHALFEA